MTDNYKQFCAMELTRKRGFFLVVHGFNRTNVMDWWSPFKFQLWFDKLSIQIRHNEVVQHSARDFST